MSIKTTTPEDVLAFLKRHPDWFRKNPEVMESLSLPDLTYRGEQVVDMHQAMLAHLQKRVSTLKADQENLVKKSRSLQALQTQVFQAVEALLNAYSFESFIHTLTREVPLIFQIDVAVLGIEAKGLKVLGLRTSGIQLLPERYLDTMMGSKNTFLAEHHMPASDVALYGSASPLVQAQVMMRLKISPNSPEGVLALGSRISSDFRFNPAEQQTMMFLSRVVETQLRAWLDLPNF